MGIPHSIHARHHTPVIINEIEKNTSTRRYISPVCVYSELGQPKSGRLGPSINLDFVVKERIEELLLSWKAFVRDVPIVSITQLRAFGFSAVVYNT